MHVRFMFFSFLRSCIRARTDARSRKWQVDLISVPYRPLQAVTSEMPHYAWLFALGRNDRRPPKLNRYPYFSCKTRYVVYSNVPRVRIPNSPPERKHDIIDVVLSFLLVVLSFLLGFEPARAASVKNSLGNCF